MTLPAFSDETATAPCGKCGNVEIDPPRKPKFIADPKRALGDPEGSGFLAWPCPVCGFMLKTATKDAAT